MTARAAQADAPLEIGSAEDASLVDALRRGEERAFASLLDRYHNSLVRLASTFVHDRGIAEEVAQETWMGVIRGIDRFEGRSSLKTWIYRILTNTARSRAEREGRCVPFSSLAGADDGGAGEPAVDPDRFLNSDDPRQAGRWASSQPSWSTMPESRLLAHETLERIQEAIALLPPTQRQVLTLRDVEGWSSEEVCTLLGLSPENQRVLLHRARSKVRGSLEKYLAAA